MVTSKHIPACSVTQDAISNIKLEANGHDQIVPNLTGSFIIHEPNTVTVVTRNWIWPDVLNRLKKGECFSALLCSPRLLAVVMLFKHNAQPLNVQVACISKNRIPSRKRVDAKIYLLALIHCAIYVTQKSIFVLPAKAHIVLQSDWCLAGPCTAMS